MPALAQETAQLAARVAEECKSIRTLLNANNENLNALNTSAKGNMVAAVNEVLAGAAPVVHTHTANQISDSGVTGRALIADESAVDARTTLELGGAAILNVGTTTGTVAAGDDARLSNARTPTAHKASHATGGTDALTASDIGAAPTSHTHTASQISDSTATGQALITAVDAASARSTLDFGNATAKTTPVDADSVLMTDSEAAGTPAKRVTFANFWTWILSKLGGNLTIGGTKTWSGQQEATGQAATNGTSVMTRDLGDARYGQVQFVQLTANEDGITNSTDYKTSDTLKVALGIGTWVLDILVYGGGGTSYATAGSRHGLSFSGTGSFNGLRQIGAQNATLTNAYPNSRNTAGFTTVTNSSTQSVSTHYRGVAVVTVAGELSVIFGCVAAVSGNTPQLSTGSYLMAVRRGS